MPVKIDDIDNCYELHKIRQEIGLAMEASEYKADIKAYPFSFGPMRDAGSVAFFLGDVYFISLTPGMWPESDALVFSVVTENSTVNRDERCFFMEGDVRVRNPFSKWKGSESWKPRGMRLFEATDSRGLACHTVKIVERWIPAARLRG
jgi:hypothetical protein